MKIKKTGRHTSALKAHRQALRRAVRNRWHRKRSREAAKALAAPGKPAEEVRKLFSEAQSYWDKAAKTGAVHWKTAARKKSRLAAALARPAKTEKKPAAA